MHDYCFIGSMIWSFLFLRCSFRHLFNYILKSEIFFHGHLFSIYNHCRKLHGDAVPFPFWPQFLPLQHSILAQLSQTCRRDAWEMFSLFVCLFWGVFFFAPLIHHQASYQRGWKCWQGTWKWRVRFLGESCRVLRRGSEGSLLRPKESDRPRFPEVGER